MRFEPQARTFAMHWDQECESIIKNPRRKLIISPSYLPIETLGFTRQNLCTGYKAVVIEGCNKNKISKKPMTHVN